MMGEQSASFEEPEAQQHTQIEQN